MNRFVLSQELPLSTRELQLKEQFFAAAEDRVPLDLVRDIGWLDMHSLKFPQLTRSTCLMQIPGQKKQHTSVVLQRHDRYFMLHLHTHVWLELLCVVHGSCAHRVGSAVGTLEQGDVLLITPGTQHVFLSAADDCIIYNVYLPLESFEQDFGGILHSQSILSSFLLKSLYADGRDSYLIFHTGEYFLRENYLAELWTEWRNPDTQHNARLTALMTLFFLDLLRIQTAPVTVSIDAPGSAGRDQMLIAYVRSHSSSVSVAELSQIFSYSERQITRIFQQTMGMSCIEYIQQCRMENFLSLLLHSDMSIARILELCGIRSTQHFTRSFKARFGMTPAQYRQEHG